MEHRIKLVPGVKEAKGDFKKTVNVKWDPAGGKLEDIEAAVGTLGYMIQYNTYPNFGGGGAFQGLFGSENTSNFTEINDKEFSKKVLKAKETVAVLFGRKSASDAFHSKLISLMWLSGSQTSTLSTRWISMRLKLIGIMIS